MKLTFIPPSCSVKHITYPAAPRNGGPVFRQPLYGEWDVMPKYNEWRGLAHVPSRTVWNNNLELSTMKIPHFWDHAKKTPFQWLDIGMFGKRCKELPLDGAIAVFDWVPVDRLTPWGMRHQLITKWFDTLDRYECPGLGQIFTPEILRVTPRRFGACDLSNGKVGGDMPSLVEAFARGLKEWSKDKFDLLEGIVLKRVDSPYPVQLIGPKRKTDNWIKHRWD